MIVLASPGDNSYLPYTYRHGLAPFIAKPESAADWQARLVAIRHNWYKAVREV